jgi:hypothetical protein
MVVCTNSNVTMAIFLYWVWMQLLHFIVYVKTWYYIFIFEWHKFEYLGWLILLFNEQHYKDIVEMKFELTWCNTSNKKLLDYSD